MPAPSPSLSRRERAWAVVVSGLLLGAVLWPLTLDPAADDDFPLSTYPMFAKARAGTGSLVHLVAIDEDGAARPVGPRWIGDRQVMQAYRTLRKAARKPKRAERLCRAAARRIADDPAWAGTTELQLRRDRYDIVGYFTSDAPAETLRIAARCEVPR